MLVNDKHFVTLPMQKQLQKYTLLMNNTYSEHNNLAKNDKIKR